jgi:hypothetical protein
MREDKVRRFMWSLGYNCSYAVSSVGLSGGLALFWSSSITVEVKACNARCIDAYVSVEESPKWRVTCVYGEPKREQRYEFFDFLRFLRSQWTGPWVCCGDFNEVLSHDEYFGPRDRTDRQISLFRSCLRIVISKTWVFLGLRGHGVTCKRMVA